MTAFSQTHYNRQLQCDVTFYYWVSGKVLGTAKTKINVTYAWIGILQGASAGSLFFWRQHQSASSEIEHQL